MSDLDLDKLEALAKAVKAAEKAHLDLPEHGGSIDAMKRSRDLWEVKQDSLRAFRNACDPSKISALIARVRELEAALKPFADEAFTYEPDEDDSWQRVWDSTLTLGDLRTARRILKGLET